MSANQQQVIDFINICTITNNRIVSPILWSITKKDKNNNFKYLMWQIILESDKTINNSDILNKTKIHNNTSYFTESGMEDGKRTTSSETIITEGKNIGKKK